MKYFKVILLIAIIIAVIRTAPETISEMNTGATTFGGLIALAIFFLVIYFLGRSTLADFRKNDDQ